MIQSPFPWRMVFCGYKNSSDASQRFMLQFALPMDVIYKCGHTQYMLYRQFRGRLNKDPFFWRAGKLCFRGSMRRQVRPALTSFPAGQLAPSGIACKLFCRFFSWSHGATHTGVTLYLAHGVIRFPGGVPFTEKIFTTDVPLAWNLLTPGVPDSDA